jgi:hypothetical protein
MTYVPRLVRTPAEIRYRDSKERCETREPVIVVVQDHDGRLGALDCICECLGIAIERMSSSEDLAAKLRLFCPMAVVTEMDAEGQDGCHVLITIAKYDRTLPALIITNDDPVSLGAIDAVEELWHVETVVKWPRLLGASEIVNFLFRAGRSGNCLRLVPV